MGKNCTIISSHIIPCSNHLPKERRFISKSLLVINYKSSFNTDNTQMKIETNNYNIICKTKDDYNNYSKDDNEIIETNTFTKMNITDNIIEKDIYNKSFDFNINTTLN